MNDDLLQEMVDPEPQRTDPSRWRRLGATVAIFALAGVGITSLTTNALFTDRETVAGDLLTGTVDLSLGTLDLGLPTSGMAPGDTYYSELAVTNSGSLALRYAVLVNAEPIDGTVGTPTLGATADAGTGTGDLRDVVSLALYPKGAAATCAAAPVPDPATAGDGAVANVDTGTAGSYADLLGSNAVGPQSYDRQLNATESETLCARVSVDLNAADNTYQDKGLTLTLRFDAEQVVNNS